MERIVAGCVDSLRFARMRSAQRCAAQLGKHEVVYKNAIAATAR